MAEQDFHSSKESHHVREAVGVFGTPDGLDDALDRPEAAGFARSAISVLASDKTVRERLGRLYGAVDEIVDDPRAPMATCVSKDDRTEGEAAVVGAPLYVGGILGGLAVIASGGAMALAFAAAIGLGLGAGAGGLLARVIAHRHIDLVWEQLSQGGLVLWVSVSDDETAARALESLIAAGASHAHLHELDREWSVKDRPVGAPQADPFLGPDEAVF